MFVSHLRSWTFSFVNSFFCSYICLLALSEAQNAPFFMSNFSQLGITLSWWNVFVGISAFTYAMGNGQAILTVKCIWRVEKRVRLQAKKICINIKQCHLMCCCCVPSLPWKLIQPMKKQQVPTTAIPACCQASNIWIFTKKGTKK